MPFFRVEIMFDAKIVYKLEAQDAVEATDICRDFFHNGISAKKTPESVFQDPEHPDNPDLVVDDNENTFTVNIVSASRFIPESEREEIRKKIFEAYGTEDVEHIYSLAASRRISTEHREWPMNEISRCDRCGLLNGETGDPIFHPEQWI